MHVAFAGAALLVCYAAYIAALFVFPASTITVQKAGF